MTTQTLETTTFFTLNTPKLHDQLDHLRAELNALARENNLGDAFHDGHLADALSDTDLGKRYQSLTRRLDILAKLPAKRTLISAGIVGGSVAWLAHRRGWDAQAIAGFKKTGAKLNRAARNLRARLTRRNPDEFPQNFNTPASAAAFDLSRTRENVIVLVPTADGQTLSEHSGILITLENEYFAVLVGEQPYLFLPDQIGNVQLTIQANGKNAAVITLTETPFFDMNLVA